ncbi:MAG: VOC family protein [Cellvibrionaceae bacterium]
MKNTGKIDYVEIPSTDLITTKKFFSKVFDWSFLDYGPDYTAIENAGLDGGFFKSDQVSTTENGSVLVVIYSAELEVSRDKVKTAGGHITKEIFDFPGGRRFHFSEPCGNEYAVWSDPKA